MSLKDAINFRKNITLYESNKMISESEIKTILEAGRLAPSSNGLEPVKVLVIKNIELKEKIAKAAFFPGNYQKISTAPVLFLFLGANGEYVSSEEFLKMRLGRVFKADLESRIKGLRDWMKTLPNLDMYSDEQAHITAAYMGLQAADLKIGCTTMGGILPASGNKFLAEEKMLDPKKYHLALALAIGHYDENKPNVYFPRTRVSEKEFYTVY